MLPAIAEAGFKRLCVLFSLFNVDHRMGEMGRSLDRTRVLESSLCLRGVYSKSVKWVRQVFNARARLADSDRDWGDLPLDKTGNPKCTKKCHICLERELKIAFLPCGHLCSCVMCAVGFTHCPIGRQSMEEIVRIFTC
jgi:hypothetical protein